VVEVSWQQAASPPHMDGSAVFARWRRCAPHLIHASLDPPESKSQTASRSVVPVLHSSPLHYNGPPLSPLKLPLPMRHLDRHLMNGSFGPPKSPTQTASRSVQPFLQGSLLWQTDHATRSVTIGRIYVGLRSTAIRPKIWRRSSSTLYTISQKGTLLILFISSVKKQN